MPRFLRFLPLVLLIAVSCSTDDSDPASASQAISFWHFYSEPGQKLALQRVVDEFTKETGVHVVLTELSWGDGKQKLQAAFSTGTAPDVIELGSDWIAQFSSAGVLMELPNDSAAVGRFVPYTLAPAMWGRKTFAYPWSVDTRVMFLNRDLLNAAGWKGAITTYGELQEACEMVMANGSYGYGANGADRHRLYKKILPMMWTYAKAHAGKGPAQDPIVNQDGTITIDSESNRKALEQYASLARTGIIETQRQLDASFIQGKIAAWNSGSWLLGRIKESGINVEAILMPGLNGQPGVSFAGGEYLAVNAKTGNTQRARQFIEYMTSAKASLQLCELIPEAGFPADKSVYQAESLTKDPLKAVFAMQLEHAQMTPVHAKWLDLEEELEDVVVRVLLGDRATKEVLEDAKDELEIITRGRPQGN